jgi:hypothetical protein
MPYADITHQPAHMPGMENIPDQPVILAKKETVILKSHNTRRILATVLKNSQCIVKKLVDV